MPNRSQLAATTENLGQKINDLRTQLIQANFPFTAGLVRAAEESLLVVLTSLNDTSVPEGEL